MCKIFSTKNSDIYFGDCLKVLENITDNSIDLIVTSPPYAAQRKGAYKWIHPDRYVSWFLLRAEQFRRVLKSDGSFILNIKEGVLNGERHPYVLELILSMREQGWLWTEEYIWHKKNSYPGKWPNRFRDSWERLLHFNKQRKFKMFQDNVKTPIGKWAKQRLKNINKKDLARNDSKTSSGFSRNTSNWLGKSMVYPTNVLYLATECGNKKHSAVFPESLPSWFIKLFTEENDIVLDPFAGSGTTLISANKLGRKAIGIDSNKRYVDLMLNRIKECDDKSKFAGV